MNKEFNDWLKVRAAHIGFCISVGLIFGVLLFIISCFVHPAHAATMSVYGGRAVSNSITDVHSAAWGVEQETGDWDFGYLNEGHQRGEKRDGIYAMRKFSYQFAKRITTSFAIGPYFTATTETASDGINYQDHYSWAALADASIRYRIDNNWSLTGRWAHVLYAARNKDADVFLIGFGYSPETW